MTAKEQNMNSSLYLELTQKELSDIISAALDGEVISAKLLTGGLFNTTYLIETSSHGKVVLRVGPVNRHLLMPFEHHLMEAEEEVYKLCAERGVPCSEVIAADTSKTLIDRDYMIVRYIPSRAMSKVSLSPEDMSRISYDIGKATAEMHEITSPRFGRITEGRNGGGFARWSEALQHELNEWEKVGIPAALFSEAEHAEIHRLFTQAVPYLDEIKTPCLVHTDLWTGNILICEDSDKPEFAAIIDADRAIWGDPFFEFSSIRWTYNIEGFWKGYGKTLPQSRTDKIRRCIYTLLNRLWNAYVYLKEYNEPDNALGEQTSAREEMAKLAEYFDE